MVFPKCPEVVGIVGPAGQAPKALFVFSVVMEVEL